MVKTKPFVIEYKQPRVLIGCEFVDSKGEIFKSSKALKEANENNDVQMKHIVFCPDCGVGNRSDKWGFPNVTENHQYQKHKGKCPNCKKKLTLEYIYDFGGAKATFNKKQIPVSSVRGKTPTKFPAYLKWWPIQNGKLTIEAVMDICFSRTMYGQYWLHHETLRYRYIFNLETGLNYAMRGVDIKGNVSKYSAQTNRLQNQTFRGVDTIHYDMSSNFIDIVLSALKEHKAMQYSKAEEKQRYGDGMETIYCCGNHRIGTSMLGWLNYFSDMKELDRNDMLDMVHKDISSNTKKHFKHLVSLSQDGEVEWLPQYMQKRSIRRRLNQRAVSFFMYKWLHACGVRDVNIMNNIVDHYIDVIIDKREPKPFELLDESTKQSIGDVVSRHCINTTENSINFMKWALKNRPAESVYQFIISALSHDRCLLEDSVRMYENLPKKNLPENVGNLKELHDTLVVVDRKFRYGNREIEHTEVEKALEMDRGEYSFRLAKDTDTLYDIGKALNICVGSYGSDAVAKRCTIMTMNKDDKYVACIELRVNKKNVQMVQLKSRFNHTVKEIGPITEWVAETGINAQCIDYKNAIENKTNGFDDRDHDYHVENPRLRNHDPAHINDADIGRDGALDDFLFDDAFIF